MVTKKIVKNRETRLKLGNLIKPLPDPWVLKFEYRIKVGKKLNLRHPTTFNEKLQWLKLHNHQPQYTEMVDKIAVRKIIADKIGEEYLVPLLGVWESYDAIDFDSLPSQFVLKCAHDSGSVHIVRDKSKMDHDTLRKFYTFRLSRSPYVTTREWPYKNAGRNIIAEEMLKDNKNDIINVYKIFNFNGEPRVFQVIMNDKQKNETVDYYNLEWNRLEIMQTYPNSETGVSKPEKLNEMITLAKKLSAGIPFVRVDFYEVGGRLYFSEYTFFTDSGYSRFQPEKWDHIMGEWLDISGVKPTSWKT